MRIAYFDCFSGISGDMSVAAFLDSGLKLSLLRKKLGLLKIGGYKIDAYKDNRSGISGTKFDVKIAQGRNFKKSAYRDIKKIINHSGLAADVKAVSISIFETLARAEAKIHNESRPDVHFHEIGDLDSLIDIVSTAIAVREMDIREFYCLNLRVGKGSVICRHGSLPLPAPAVLEMLRGKPVLFSDAEYELITPTGAAILTTLVKDFNSRPAINIEAVGYGAGTFEIEGNPNLLRLVMGSSNKDALGCDEIVVIETNIDDMNPVYYEYLIEKLFKNGALDVYLTGVYAKKTRPGILLTVLAKGHLLDILAGVIMKETTSSGVRYYKAQRKILDRFIKTVKTKYGSVKVKVNSGGGGINTVSPEYDDCKQIAERTGVPIKVIFDEAREKIKLK